MHRSFSRAPINPKLLLRILDDALRSPTAGNAQGVFFLALTEESDRTRYWSTATDEKWRNTSNRFPGFQRAPVIVLVLCDPARYTNRYSAADKSASGLGHDVANWPVPYWFGDAGMAAMALLLGAEASGLGASFLGTFRNEQATLEAFSVPAGTRLFGTILLGHSDGQAHRSKSLDTTLPRSSRIHVGRFGSTAQAVDEGVGLVQVTQIPQ